MDIIKKINKPKGISKEMFIYDNFRFRKECKCLFTTLKLTVFTMRNQILKPNK